MTTKIETREGAGIESGVQIGDVLVGWVVWAVPSVGVYVTLVTRGIMTQQTVVRRGLGKIAKCGWLGDR